VGRFVIDRHRSADCPVEDLAETAAGEGHVFVERMRSEWNVGVNRFDRPGESVFVARVDGAIVGVCGLNIDPFLDDPAVGRLRHLYVDPDHRRAGIGRSLVDECRRAALQHFDVVRLRTFNPAADAFYRAVGFTRVQDETATHIWRVRPGPSSSRLGDLA
jgi:GNAT superfamily N-acetyltransferase